LGPSEAFETTSMKNCISAMASFEADHLKNEEKMQ
jgi:hypothetical protein